MKKKLFLIVLGGLVAAVIAAVLLLPHYVNRLKPQIEQAVQQATGRSLRLSGDLGLSWYPYIGIELGAAQLGNAPDFDTVPFAEVDQALVRVALLPLWHGEIKVQALQIKGLQLNLAVDKQGHGNWEDLLSASESQPSAAQQDTHLPPWSLAGLTIEEAALHWHDIANGSQWSIAPFNLKVGTVVMDQPVDFELQTAVHNRAPAIDGRLQLKGRASYAPHTERIHIPELALDFSEIFVEDLPFTRAQPLKATLRGAVEANLKTQTVQLAPMQLELKGQPKPDMHVDLALQGKGELDLTRQQFHLAEAVLTIAAKGGPAGESGIKALLKTTLHADLQAQSASLNPLHIEGLEMELDGNLNIKQRQGSPHLQGTIKIPPFSPRKTLSALNRPLPQTSPPELLSAGALAVNFEASPQELLLPRVQLALDQSQIEGKLRIKDYTHPDVVLLLNANTLDLDRYMALLGETSPDSEGSRGHVPRPLKMRMKRR